eukprot:jgi/Chlat1/4468/Chrsp29S04416
MAEHFNGRMDESGVKPDAPVLCANNCGFYGNPMSMNLCSKCYRDTQQKERAQQAVAAVTPEAMDICVHPALVEVKQAAEVVYTPAVHVEEPMPAATTSETQATGSAGPAEDLKKLQKGGNRCFSCSKRVGLTGFKCRCGFTYCTTHRYSDKHNCTFDYKAAGRDAIAKANPTVVASKVEKI